MKNKVAIKFTLLFASMLTILANAIIAPALPEIYVVFGSNENAEILSKLLMTLPSLTIALFSVSIGKWIDRFGRLKILNFSLLIFALAGTSGLWIKDLNYILLGRFFLGFGVAGIMTASTTLIGDYFKGSERKQLIGLQGALAGFGGLVFITLAGFLADIQWNLPFAIYGCSLIVLLFSFWYLVEPSKFKKQNETIIQETGRNNSYSKSMYLIYFSAFIGFIVFYILPLQIPFYLKSLESFTNTMSGLAIAALTTSQAIAAFFYTRIKKKLDYNDVYGVCFFIMMIGYIVISLSDSFINVVVGLLISGLGFSWLMPNSFLWLIEITNEEKRGKAMGILTTFIFSGQFVSPIILQPLQSQFGTKHTFLILSMILGLTTIFFFFNTSKKIIT